MVTVMLAGLAFTDEATVPLTFLDRIELDFVLYEQPMITVTTLYRLQCTNVYQHGTARVMGYLTHARSSGIDVTSSSEISSESTGVVIAGSRIQAVIAGVASISAIFGSAVVMSTVLISETILDVHSIMWSLGGTKRSTLSGFAGSTYSATVSVIWQSMKDAGLSGQEPATRGQHTWTLVAHQSGCPMPMVLHT